MALDSVTRDGTQIGALSSSKAAPNLQTDPSRYISLSQILDTNKPDNRDLLVNIYGDQGITGFLTLTGATKNAGTADEVTWWEEGRLHKTFNGTYDADGAVGSTGVGELTSSITPGVGNAGTTQLRLNDVVLTQGGLRLS